MAYVICIINFKGVDIACGTPCLQEGWTIEICFDIAGANELSVWRCCICSKWGTTELQNPHLARLCISIWHLIHLELPEFLWIVCQGHNGFPHTSRIYMIEMDWRFDYMMSECLIYTWIRWLACWLFFLSSAKGAIHGVFGLHHWGRIWQSSDELWSRYWERSWIILWLMATFQIPSKDRRLGLVNLFGWLCLGCFFFLVGCTIVWSIGFSRLLDSKWAASKGFLSYLLDRKGWQKRGSPSFVYHGWFESGFWCTTNVHHFVFDDCYSFCSDVVGRWWSDTRWIWARFSCRCCLEERLILVVDSKLFEKTPGRGIERHW